MDAATMVWLIWGAVAALELVVLYLAVRMLRQAAMARRLETTRISQITRPGVYEATGQVVSPHPVVCLGHKCVWYEYERRRHGRRHSRREWAEKEFVPFMVRDETGLIGVDPSRAKVDAKRLLGRHALDPGGATLLRPGWVIHERLNGIEVDSPVYVAGPVVRQGEVLSFEAGDEGPLLISYRSETAFRRSRLVRAFCYVALAAATPIAAWYLLERFGQTIGS